uniref:Putative group ii salivary lipocalin n=1 Tax=Rhipicephalus pulchellus TaxID=72859 RepID=L7LT76_RHIPC
MSSFRLVLCTMLVACAFAGKESYKKNPNAYAEDQQNFKRQNISFMTSVQQTFYVRRRDYNTNTSYRCLSARQVFKHGNGSYEYTLKARYLGRYRPYNVTMTPKKTGNHTFENSAYYEEFPGKGATHHKLMTTNDEHTCFLFATEYTPGVYGCLLVVTEDIVKKQIPKECLMVYKEQCQRGVDLYRKKCV